MLETPPTKGRQFREDLHNRKIQDRHTPFAIALNQIQNGSDKPSILVLFS
jgi:hypothetical protein